MEKRRKRKMRKKCRRNIFLGIIILLTIFLGGLIMGKERSNQQPLSYISVHLQKGDTLWQIAEKYKLDGMDTERMIEEIIQLNCLKNTNIQAGENIIVPVVV